MRTSIAFIALFAAVLLMACNPKKAEPPKPKEEKPAPWNMTLQTDPAKPQMSKDVTFVLSMTDKQGKPLTGAEVKGSLVMTLMDMGKNEFNLAGKGNGAYEGKGKMDMAGPWELVITAKAGGVEGQKTFPLTVGE